MVGRICPPGWNRVKVSEWIHPWDVTEKLGEKSKSSLKKNLRIAVKNLPKQHFDQRIKVTETKKFSLLGFIEVAISFGQIVEYCGHKFQCVLVTRTNSFGNFDQIRLAWNPP